MSIKQVLRSLNLGSIRSFLMALYHREGRGRKPYPAVCMLKAQLLKHLWRVPSDRRLSLLLKRNRRVAKACGFKHETPSHGLFTQFRHRLGKDGYEKVFSLLVKPLLKNGAVKAEVVAVDSTAVKAYSQRSLDNKSGKVIMKLGLAGVEEAFYLAIECMPYAVQALSCRLRLWWSLVTATTNCSSNHY